jgi:SAM-dependent methyltransferase
MVMRISISKPGKALRPRGPSQVRLGSRRLPKARVGPRSCKGNRPVPISAHGADRSSESGRIRTERPRMRKQSVSVEVAGVKILAPLEDVFTENFDKNYVCYYNNNDASLLSGLCDKYGSDKGQINSTGHPYHWPSHSYADFVERHFEHCREYIKNVFECGLGTGNPKYPSNMGKNARPGASLRAWRDYFPNANIFGADIDRDILFSEERIATFHCDQTNPQSVSELWENIKDVDFDLMIDDGLHAFEANVCLFENSFHRLKKGGIYIIEDVAIPSLFKFIKYFKTTGFNYEIVNLYRKDLSLEDNSLVIIRK